MNRLFICRFVLVNRSSWAGTRLAVVGWVPVPISRKSDQLNDPVVEPRFMALGLGSSYSTSLGLGVFSCRVRVMNQLLLLYWAVGIYGE